MEIIVDWLRTRAVAELWQLISVSMKTKAVHTGRPTDMLIGLRDPEVGSCTFPQLFLQDTCCCAQTTTEQWWK